MPTQKQSETPEEYAIRRARWLSTHEKSKNVIDKRVRKPFGEVADRITGFVLGSKGMLTNKKKSVQNKEATRIAMGLPGPDDNWWPREMKEPDRPKK